MAPAVEPVTTVNSPVKVMIVLVVKLLATCAIGLPYVVIVLAIVGDMLAVTVVATVPLHCICTLYVVDAGIVIVTPLEVIPRLNTPVKVVLVALPMKKFGAICNVHAAAGSTMLLPTLFTNVLPVKVRLQSWTKVNVNQ